MTAFFKACVSCGCMLEGDEVYMGFCVRCRPREKKTRRPSGVPKAAAPAPALSSEPAKKKTILIIDDEPLLRKLLKKRLESAGYAVETASDGEEGYRKIKSRRPDIVISDVLMPKMTGYDLLKKIKKETDGTQHIPVLIMSAKGGMENFFSEWEIHSYLKKPIDPAELLNKVAELLKLARQKRRA